MWQFERFLWLIPAAVLILLISACSEKRSGEETDHPFNWKESSWEEIEAAAEDTEVTFHMWGGSVTINTWIDDVVSDLLLEKYKLRLRRIPMDAPLFVNRLLAEKNAGRKEGSIDLIWINGENFKRAMEGNVLAGPFTDILPNFQNYVDPATAAFDFGFPTRGYESPYGRAQFVFEYDTAAASGRPESFLQLSRWVRNNPGLFTYPEPSDFTGSAFIRQLYIALNGGSQRFLQGWDPDLYAETAPVLWDYLVDIAPFLWQEGRSYPRDLAMLDSLFERGEVAVNMSYTQANAQARIIEGRYPATVRSFVMEEGSLFNTHFTAIAFNAPNPAGALVLANLLLDPEIQASKYDPANWGDFTVLDMTKLPASDREGFERVDPGPATLPLTELEAAAIPEIPSEYLEALQEDWYRHVPGS
jgi:putative spermidine/putrescine transport system substrate-binding protein